jgi:carbonic anhydrase
LTAPPDSSPAAQALARLRAGNRRFVAGRSAVERQVSHGERARMAAAGQHPFAIVLGCSDARVPAELVFDQGFGDLFMIRVAGNIVAPSQVGSVEFAASQFGTPLVVVLGHSRCGAIDTTLRELLAQETQQSRNLRVIVDRIRPSVEPLLANPGQMEPTDLAARAVRANVRASVEQLRTGSDILGSLIEEGRLHIVGAVYSLETGEVAFLDD